MSPKLPPMPHTFSPDVVAAILRHMNDDHRDDNLLIVRAFVDGTAVSAEMVDLDGDGGEWRFTTGSGSTADTTIPWPAGPIAERMAVRREIVALYDESCRRLDVEPRPHN